MSIIISATPKAHQLMAIALVNVVQRAGDAALGAAHRALLTTTEEIRKEVSLQAHGHTLGLGVVQATQADTRYDHPETLEDFGQVGDLVDQPIDAVSIPDAVVERIQVGHEALVVVPALERGVSCR